MADKPKKFTSGELARQFVKEVASGAFSRSKGGSAANAARTVAGRSARPEGMPNANTYRSRQFTDDNN